MVAKTANRLDSHTDCDATHRQADDDRDQGFDAAVPVRVVFIGRRRPESNAEDHRDIGDRIGQTVDGIGEHRLAVAEDSGHRLDRGQQQVDQQADPTDRAYL